MFVVVLHSTFFFFSPNWQTLDDVEYEIGIGFSERMSQCNNAASLMIGRENDRVGNIPGDEEGRLSCGCTYGRLPVSKARQ